MNVEEELKKIPTNPGVYIYHDAVDAIIYIGKAVNLKNRVRQYFHGGDGRSMLTRMVPQIARIEYIVTDSELEALVLENNLIKEHRPKYNTLLKDDKTYPYIKVTVNETFPRILLTRKLKRDKAKYFGPFSDAGAVRSTIDLLVKTCKLRTCNRKILWPNESVTERACLNYHMGQCLAPCQGHVTPEAYNAGVERAIEFLKGTYQPLLRELEEKMQQASANLEFEQAAIYKQQLEDARAVAQKQKITTGDGDDRDILAVAIGTNDAVVQVLFVRDGRLMGREHFYMKLPEAQDVGEILSNFIRQYYSGTPFLPKEFFLQEEIPDMELLAQWLSEKKGQNVYFRVPRRGQKEKLVELAKKNARLILEQDREKLRREEQRTTGAMRDLGQMIGIGELKRIEAYDISNISGYNMVGSMVVFENGKPKRNDYRKFRIRSLSGQNDYAALKEVLTRRFTHGLREQNEEKEGKYDSFRRFPDVILMDGGKGQVHIAEEVMRELDLHVPICGMVKDDHHRTRGLYVNDKEVPIAKDSPAFHLITRVQDEAHRFAITFHRSLRSKGQVHSVLDEIPGIGPARRKALMKRFVSIDALQEASIETLAETDSMNQRAAEEVYRFFHAEESTESNEPSC